MNTRELNPEVVVAVDGIVHVGRQDIERLQQKAAGNPRQRIRLCTHRSVEESLHEMLIVHARDCYVRPHMHVDKAESVHVIEGEADLILFSEEGALTEVVRLGPYGSRQRFYCRLQDGCFHALLIRSDVFVFHETTQGPFRREATVFAPWAPEDGQPGIAGYQAQLSRDVKAWLEAHQQTAREAR